MADPIKPTEAAELARAMVATGTPERLYEIAEKFPIGDPARDACFKIAAVLSRVRSAKNAGRN